MNFSISVRSMFAIMAYIICFTVSYFLLWDDHMRLSHFHIDPFQSKVTRFIVKNVMWNMKDEARLLGVILAFSSIHLSWHFRYFVGDRLMAAYARHKQKSSTAQTAEPADTNNRTESSSRTENSPWVEISQDKKPTIGHDSSQ